MFFTRRRLFVSGTVTLEFALRTLRKDTSRSDHDIRIVVDFATTGGLIQ